MAKTLVIVESPAKAKTINKYLPRGYNVEATMGHVRDLPKSKLGIDIDNNFEPSYVTIRGKGDILKKIKSESNSADKILLATDPDREGEAISWHIAKYLKLDENEIYRIEFHEITKEAIKNAINNKRKIDMNLVNSQQARRILDRLVGYSISPLLWKKVRKGLSAGRVQSVATRIIVDREKEIMDFVSEEYWILSLKLTKDGESEEFEAKFYGIDNKKVEIKSKEQIEEIVDNLKDDILVSKIKESKKVRKPPFPFTTSTLQQEAFKKLNFSTKKTMSIAQQLYEGLSIEGQGHVGLITYMRTDSIRISDTAKESCKNYILTQYGKEYIGNNSKAKLKGKNVQDAHEAIRPTSMELEPIKVKDSLKRDQYRLYKLIWNRLVASQMSEALYDTLSIDITSGKYNFRSSGSKQVFKGFLKVYDDSSDEKDESNDEKNRIPSLINGDKLTIEKIEQDQKFTSPPARFSEASLVKILEEKGIGRPSTYSPTIQTILNRGYVEVEEKKFHPTELGFLVNDLMEEYFKDVVDLDFTVDMEESLDSVAEGNREWQDIIEKFYINFAKELEYAEEVMEEIKIEDPVSDVKCENCGKFMVIKTGRYGKFLACPGFPDCRNAKPFLEELGVKCPECADGDLVVRKTKKGRNFYGCKNYPECTYMTWDRPIEEKCPKCQGLLLQKGFGNRKKIYCPDEECGYTQK
ncbi:type I DNA topoisomerase [Alkalibaculum sp. M08DMB]|uniref:DNA topoisomerase 1 n=1 Tax=Alkalibaculum sporogenes TaxID=2655001 RepID=A0A6A7K793_9FIRM|nr:type I DNA topoisomerase [Alkalibaculum sporogenes]MPW25294.1 type I DNA topoisomerase [Alkalibaculum sporogenes]